MRNCTAGVKRLRVEANGALKGAPVNDGFVIRPLIRSDVELTPSYRIIRYIHGYASHSTSTKPPLNVAGVLRTKPTGTAWFKFWSGMRLPLLSMGNRFMSCPNI